MSTITIRDKKFTLYLSASDIQKRVYDIANSINKEMEGKKPLFLAILNGSFVFAADLIRCINIPCEICFCKLSSYSGMNSTGKVEELIGLNTDITNRNIIIIEDIIDSGTTMKTMLELLKKKSPADIKIASLLVKPDNMKVKIPISYHCFDIPNDFIVGYGLDYDEEGRNLKDIYVVTE